MPGPRNSKKQRKQQATKDKARQRNILKDLEQNARNVPSYEDVSTVVAAVDSLDPNERPTEKAETVLVDSPRQTRPNVDHCLQSGPPADDPFIVDPGNGPRVKNMDLFLSSFFCPPISTSDESCTKFARKEIVTVLLAILPKEVALIVWYNRTRTHERICPACQRLYRVGDILVDPLTGDIIDVNNPKTPPNVVREQTLSGFCSFSCFFLASYSSHPYTTEVASGAWGLLSDELDSQVRSLLDATDPRTTAIMRYGLAAYTASQSEDQENIDNQGLGRVLRLTRRKDLGLGEVLEALAWYDNVKEKASSGRQ